MRESILEKIVKARENAPRKTTDEELKAKIAGLPPCRAFAAAFKGDGIHVIAELKKASPSKGLIRPDFQPVELAKALELAGAAALSVLTEPDCFLGSLRYLEEVRKHVSIPLLRKDFITKEYQILEARAAGADAVLLIAAALEEKRFVELREYAESLGLAALCEAHCAKEIEMLVRGGAKIIGVNARDLSSFDVSLDTSLNLLGEIPAGTVRIAESGIKSKEDIRRFREEGADGFLIGETLMRAEFPGEKLKELLA